ncbi:protein Rf1, mitochondrial-like [Lolium rigidum]|uniref:protein Rf1, mitochondrial-like n=1 Tax=Lolium rigidum TaxID=89674 RepID=UPI001F5C4DFA|nr:protein Rf1, mitochondrial-like [Lolium rigidum]
MPPRYSTTTPVSRIRRRLSSTTTTTSPARPSRSWSPHAAFAAATERARAGTLSPEDAHHLFDDLLRQAAPVSERSLDSFLAALARAPDSGACRDGSALAIALFNRARREEAVPRVARPTIFTYGVLMNCCCRALRPDLGLAFFGLLLRTGLKKNVIIGSTLLKCLCYAKRTDEAVNVLFHRMSELGCVPDALSYNIVLKGLCEDGRSQQALDLLQKVRKDGGACSPDVVTYNTVIHGFFKEGEIGKACDLFHEMQQMVVPDVVTYNSIIDALCKARVMDKAELFLRQMVERGVQPNEVTYTSIIHGYSSLGKWKEASRLFRKMTSLGLIPNIVTWSSFMASLCKHGRTKEAAGVFDSMTAKGHKPNIVTYGALIHGNKESVQMYSPI